MSPGTHMFWNCESQMMTNESHIIRTNPNALPDPQTNIKLEIKWYDQQFDQLKWVI